MSCEKTYLTPLAHTVSRTILNPLNILHSGFLVLTLVLLGLLNFNYGALIVPIIIFELVSVIAAPCTASKLKNHFGAYSLRGFSIISLILSFGIAVLSFILQYTNILKFDLAFITLSFEHLPEPLNLLNTSVYNLCFALLGITLLYLAKAVFSGTLASIVKTNLPKNCGFLLGSIISCFSLAVFCIGALDLLGFTSLFYKTENLETVAKYTNVAVFILGFISAGISVALNIYTYIKTRKNSHVI